MHDDSKSGAVYYTRHKSGKVLAVTDGAKSYRAEFIAVPILWGDRLLNEARGAATFKLALHLLSRDYVEHRKTYRLANVALAEIGITPRQKWRALAELEKLGLIRIIRRTRKSPMVTLLHLREVHR
jgi:hypothetical protein